MGAYTTFLYYYLPASAEASTTGLPLFNAAFEATDGVIHGQIQHHTADDALTEVESRKFHTNLGASGTVVLTLPQSVTAGLLFHFIVLETFELRIDPGAAGAIYISGAKQTDDKYITANAINESITVVSIGSGDWSVFSPIGTWTVEA